MFSTELGLTLEAAFREATSRRHAFFCLEHLLYALSYDEQIIEILEKVGVQLQTLRKDLEQFFDRNVEVVPLQGAKGFAAEPAQTPAVQRVLQKAILHVRSAQKDVITPAEVLVAIFSEEDSHAVYFLAKQGVTRLDILNYLAHGVSKAGTERVSKLTSDLEEDIDEQSDEDSLLRAGSALAMFTEDITALARAGKLDPVIGRAEEIARTIKILCRRQKNNPLFLGEPGVGKTAMANAIASRIVEGQVPEQLADAEVFLLNMGNLVAGTKFRGEFEDRIRKVITEVTKRPKAILFIDEIHTVVGAGATGNGSLDAANLLKPALASGAIRCMGSTTHTDYKKSIEKDRALSRRFSTVELPEPSIEETITILEGLKSKFEEYHKVAFTPKALRAATELSAKYINERFLPDKAIDVIDEAGAANALLPKQKRRKTITEEQVESVVAAVARVPVKSVNSSDEEILRNLESNLAKRVFGQDRAVESIARAIKRSRASLQSLAKPIGSFLFAGPTGVGKTELARALAQELGVHFHRFDMSEFHDKHLVSRFTGAPPGYVGYEEGGLLVDLVRKHPHGVILFDEIEKAHPDVFNIFLQIMDDATITDSQGRKADFRNIIVIFTTNAGSEKAASLGFGVSKANDFRDTAVKALFKPEFRNRLDDTIYFSALPLEVIVMIVGKFIRDLEAQLAEREITFDVSREAQEWLAKKGFDPVFGARPMARLIQKELKDPLADEILFGKLKNGGRVSISLKDEGLTFELPQ
ncbi:MAG: ATP-dependent Clp protease ATP-binding subunit ClpA [Pseudomonadota bacterium]|jgi:ATP-dependent Clp protease ATP-binding subunit ClpA